VQCLVWLAIDPAPRAPSGAKVPWPRALRDAEAITPIDFPPLKRPDRKTRRGASDPR
jgi:hypothetical protein